MAKRHRKERVGDLLLECISEVYRKLKDPGIPSEGLVSFLRIDVASDLAYANVLYSYLGDDSKLKDLQDALDRSGGFFRREINRVVRLRKIPELRFHLDKSMERGSEILTLLEKVRVKESRSSTDNNTGDPAEDSA